MPSDKDIARIDKALDVLARELKNITDKLDDRIDVVKQAIKNLDKLASEIAKTIPTLNYKKRKEDAALVEARLKIEFEELEERLEKLAGTQMRARISQERLDKRLQNDAKQDKKVVGEIIELQREVKGMEKAETEDQRMVANQGEKIKQMQQRLANLLD